MGVFLLISATSIKADVREQQAMSRYLQQLDLQTMQKIATLVADYRAAGKTVTISALYFSCSWRNRFLASRITLSSVGMEDTA